MRSHRIVAEDFRVSSTMEFEAWLEQRIATLSVDALNRNVLTCTACGEVTGDYIIEYRGESLRYQAPKAYAFLKYVLETTQPDV